MGRTRRGGGLRHANPGKPRPCAGLHGSLGDPRRRPLWQIVDSALHFYIGSLPEADRRHRYPGATGLAVAARTPRHNESVGEWVSLADFIGSGEFGGSGMSRLSKKAIGASAR